MSREDLIEKLAAIEHEQWMHWEKALLRSEHAITRERRERWTQLMVPYDELPESVKEADREWARHALDAMAGELR